MKARGRRAKGKTPRGCVATSGRADARRKVGVPADRQEAMAALKREISEAREQQAATSEVLEVIHRSPDDLNSVFQCILANATRLCEAKFATLYLFDGDAFTAAAMYNAPAAYVKNRQSGPIRPDPGTALARVMATKRPVHAPDIKKEEAYLRGASLFRTAVRLGGYRSMISVPMLRNGKLIGAIAIQRKEVRPFSKREISLVKNFATQAVIAIGNARHLTDLRQRTSQLGEALEQQTATSEILGIIGGSPTDVKPVLDAIVRTAVTLCDSYDAVILLGDEGCLRVAAHHGPMAIDFERLPLERDLVAGRTVIDQTTVHVPDLTAETREFPKGRDVAVRLKQRTVLGLPMMREGRAVGCLFLRRTKVQPFTDKQIQLLQTFAAQAVIAIENTRLFNELRQRTDDLGESLERQTATSEVLSVIAGSPDDLEPVFQTMLRNATKLCEANFASLVQFDEKGMPRLVSSLNIPAPVAEFLRSGRHRPTPLNAFSRMIASRKPVHVIDYRTDPAYLAGDPVAVGGVELGGIRSLLIVPMQRDSELIGAFGIYRQEVRPFTDKQIELVSNFAAQAVIAIENARLLNELRHRTDDLTESLEQQTATTEVLKVISSSPGDLEPVFDTLLVNATRMCGAKFGALSLRDGNNFRSIAMIGAPPAFADQRQRDPMIRPTPGHILERLLLTENVIHVPDLETDKGAAPVPYELAGARAALNVPLRKDNELIGSLLIYRQEKGSFSAKQIELVQNFAAQAVIAIENARLLNELRERTSDLSEALEQQTAISDILRAISSSPGDVKPVMEVVAERAARICEANVVDIIIANGDNIHVVATFGELGRPTGQAIQLDRSTVMGRSICDKTPVHIADLQNAPDDFRLGRELAVKYGHRSILAVPLVREDRALGAILVRRPEVRPFEDKHIALLKTFADQAAIAIENTRLLNELRQRTDDLTESLEYQTAIGEILGVISKSPTQVQPVFDIIAASALRLCTATWSGVLLFDGEVIDIAAIHNLGNFESTEALRRSFPRKPSRTGATDRAISSKVTCYIPDVLEVPGYDHDALAQSTNYRSILSVPMLRDGQSVGAITVVGAKPHAFAERQVALLRTFADQAVIAIGNVRLFDEVQKRTEELSESLQQQTATADVLKVISRSTFDLQTVLDTLVESATRLCEADSAFIFRLADDGYRLSANHGFSREYQEWMGRQTISTGSRTLVGRTSASRRPVHIPDAIVDPEYGWAESIQRGGFRTMLGIPLLREGAPIGVMALCRSLVQPFSDKQIDLVNTFADQAVIAIENVRLFDEVQKRTEDLAESLAQQTATADVLKVISRSAFDLHIVLDTLLKSAARLCEADQGTITQRKGDIFYRSVAYGYPQVFMDYVKDIPVEVNRNTGTGRALVDRKVIHIVDVQNDPEYTWKEAQQLGGFRTMLGVPMLRENEAVGVLTLTRADVRPFTEKQIELVSTFADQAAIAIENVRLFDEIQEKSRQLAEASQHKSQFLANMSHELRTPLNAILGYTELIIDNVYGEPPERVRTVLDRITRNGKHLLGLINDVLDLSKIEAGQLKLDLADYSIKDVVHSVYSAVEPLAVSKSLGFKVDVAPNLPVGHGDERRLTQVLLNLVGNAIKFTDRGEVAIKAGTAEGSFNLSVHDTGPGISEADQKKLFQEFQQADNSTTKAKGGTGLGLAISKRIIEMHGGRIWVESRLGHGSMFSLTLPIKAEQQGTQP